MKKSAIIFALLCFWGSLISQTALPKNPIMYEVNLRHHTKEGTINAFARRLPELKALGVNVVWIMPSQPIGKKNRKATGDTFVQDLVNPSNEAMMWDKYKGSPYSISDYTAVNPDYGTVDDFKALVEKCHRMGMIVILDWVGNHTAWDHAWITDHPEWYTKNSKGEITDPLNEDGSSIGWTDVADLNYDNEELRKAMRTEMRFWVEEVGLDGFRCDVAMNVPAAFWESAVEELKSIKPIFMLAEAEEHNMKLYDKAFDAYYGWQAHEIMNKIAKGEAKAGELCKATKAKYDKFPKDVFPMNFITNHDENCWNGTLFERMGDAWKALAVYSYMAPGIPLLYTGQEMGNNKRLKFFEKDDVAYPKDAMDYFRFYQNLGKIRSAHPELGISKELNLDAEMTTLKGDDVITFVRRDTPGKSNNMIWVCINLSNETKKLPKAPKAMDEKENVILTSSTDLETLEPWGYRVVKMK
ncbi:MAG: alpha-amylase family glycosyl hydrolase [Bacteroidia bacterium]